MKDKIPKSVKGNHPKLEKIRKEAIARIAKSQQLQIRFEPEQLEALLMQAGKCRQPLSSMVREWISDRLEVETKSGQNAGLVSLTTKIDELLLAQQEMTKIQRATQDMITDLLVIAQSARKTTRTNAVREKKSQYT